MFSPSNFSSLPILDFNFNLTATASSPPPSGSSTPGSDNDSQPLSHGNGSRAHCVQCPDFTDPADDAVWILTSTFIIFTMQSGFGLLESGSVTTKNEVNIMVKNAVDVIVGGLSYWAFGYAFSFGTDPKVSNAFCGWGYFFVAVDESRIGYIYSHFFFQSSFATTATTIVSGAMAERTKLEAYIIFSLLNTLVFCFPAHWVWAENGFLHKMGMVDIAGDGPVHLVGGVTGLVATLMLKPRHGRWDSKYPPPMGSPTNALLGMFMLWWGWLGFNCGSTFGISGLKWKLAARSAVATLCASVGGGCVGLGLRSAVSTMTASIAGGVLAFGLSYIVKSRKFDVGYIINGLLGSLVSITGLCALARPWEGLVIGATGGLVALGAIELLNKLRIDDPVGCVGVHAVGACWGLLAVGLFARSDDLRTELGITHDEYGLFYGGGWYLLGVQVLGVVVIASWTAVTSFILLKLIDVTLGLRVDIEHEILGADLVEHAVGEIEYDKVTNTFVNMCRVASPSGEPGGHIGDTGVPSEERPHFNEAHIRKRNSKNDAYVSQASYLAMNGNENGNVATDSSEITSAPSDGLADLDEVSVQHFLQVVLGQTVEKSGKRSSVNGQRNKPSSLRKRSRFRRSAPGTRSSKIQLENIPFSQPSGSESIKINGVIPIQKTNSPPTKQDGVEGSLSTPPCHVNSGYLPDSSRALLRAYSLPQILDENSKHHSLRQKEVSGHGFPIQTDYKRDITCRESKGTSTQLDASQESPKIISVYL